MKPRSLTARLFAGTAALLLIGLTVGGAGLSFAFRRSVEGSYDQRLDALLLAVIGTLEVPPDGPLRVPEPVADSRFERAYSGWYWQVSGGGDVLRSRSLWDAVLPLAAAPADGEAGPVEVDGPRGRTLRVRARALRYPSRQEPVIVVVAGPEDELGREIRRFDRLLAVSLGALGLGLAGALALQVGYGLRPLRRLAAELAAVRSGRVSRLGGEYPGEIQPLVTAMNHVLDHDAGLIERARTHVGNLAHALKTPLAVVSGESARPAADRARLAEQVGVMNRLVEHHLARAAAAGTRRVIGARTDVAEVVDALRETLARLHAGRGVAIETSTASGAGFAGERQDLEEMLGNLMDNACKWAAGRVMVDVVATNGRLRIRVDDDGPGLGPEDAARAFDRGARLDDGAPGSGLGLTIAADLASLYGGTLHLARSRLGGLRADLDLPSDTP